MTHARAVVGFWMILTLIVGLLTGCGGGGSPATQISDPMILEISPSSAAVSLGQTAQFTADTAVTWSVNSVVGGSAATGLISSGGLYTPPNLSAPSNFTIRAVSTANPALPASATVHVFVPGVVSATGNPQVAQCSISTFPGSTVTVQFGPDRSYGLKTWAVPSAGSGETSVLVAGMKGATTYHVQGLVQLPDGTQFTDADHTFTTSALSAQRLPSIAVTTAPGATPASGVELLNLTQFGGPQVNVVATDLQGNVIWYYDLGDTTQIPNPAKLLPNGHMLINYSQSGTDGTGSIMQEIDLAGNIVWQMTAADLNQAMAAAGYNLTLIGTHHDFALLPNGHMILLASMNQSITNLVGYPDPTTMTGDVLIDLDENHKPVWTWSSFDHLDVNRHLLAFPPDWTHTNAILYSQSDGNLVISMRHQSWIIKIDYADGQGTGDIIWKLGWQGDFTLVGGTDPIDWFYAQHAPYFVTANTSGQYELGLFDNGDNAPEANGSNCGVAPTAPCESRVQIFQIDEVARTATIEWQDKLPMYSFYGGYTDTLPNGNIEFDECAATLTPASAAIYEVTPSSNPQTVWQMQIAGENAYRAFRIPSLYPGVQW